MESRLSQGSPGSLESLERDRDDLSERSVAQSLANPRAPFAVTLAEEMGTDGNRCELDVWMLAHKLYLKILKVSQWVTKPSLSSFWVLHPGAGGRSASSRSSRSARCWGSGGVEWVATFDPGVDLVEHVPGALGSGAARGSFGGGRGGRGSPGGSAGRGAIAGAGRSGPGDGHAADDAGGFEPILGAIGALAAAAAECGENGWGKLRSSRWCRCRCRKLEVRLDKVITVPDSHKPHKPQKPQKRKRTTWSRSFHSKHLGCLLRHIRHQGPSGPIWPWGPSIQVEMLGDVGMSIPHIFELCQCYIHIDSSIFFTYFYISNFMHLKPTTKAALDMFRYVRHDQLCGWLLHFWAINTFRFTSPLLRDHVR